MIHEIGVNGVLEIAATEVREEDIYCFCAVTFLESSMVLNPISTRFGKRRETL